MTSGTSILYLSPVWHVDDPMFQRRITGVRRFARIHGLPVVVCHGGQVIPANLPAILDRYRPAGCIAECWWTEISLPPALFGSMPVVYFEAPDGPGWRSAMSVDSDSMAVARAAFRELAKSSPPVFAAVSYQFRARWSDRRVEAFRSVCADAGAKCISFRTAPGEDAGTRNARLAKWVAALPPHAAVFAVDDPVASKVLSALEAVGRRPPHSATLVGVDAVEARMDSPGCDFSSVRLDFELSGYLAARTLVERIGAQGRNGDQRSLRQPAPPRILFSPLLVERRQSTYGRGRRENWIMDAVDTIRREACDGLTPASLIARFRCSRRLFDLRFREALGHTAQDEIEQVRLEKVFELLRGDTPVGAIASLCGWRSDIALRRTFRLRTGMSMRDWRTRNRQR